MQEKVDNIQPNIIHKYSAYGSASVDETTGALTRPSAFHSLDIHLGSAPSAHEEISVSVDKELGAEYDTLVFKFDMQGVVDLHVNRDDFDVTLGAADAMAIEWTNTDAVSYAIELTMIEDGL